MDCSLVSLLILAFAGQVSAQACDMMAFMGCFQPLGGNMPTLPSSSEINKLVFISSQDVQGLCQNGGFATMKQCVDAQPEACGRDNQMTYFMWTIYDGFEYMCSDEDIYEEFVDEGDCRTDPVLKQEISVCYEGLDQRLMNPQIKPQETCTQIQTSVKCSHEYMAAKCGQDIADYSVHFTQRILGIILNPINCDLEEAIASGAAVTSLAFSLLGFSMFVVIYAKW